METQEGLVRQSFVGEGFVYQSIFPAMEEAAKLIEPLPWPRSVTHGHSFYSPRALSLIVLEVLEAVWQLHVFMRRAECAFTLALKIVC